MLKLIIILVLLIYLLNKVSVFLFKAFGPPRPQAPNFNRPPDGSIHMDKKPTKKGGVKGGEYVDYEEVK